MKAKPMLIVIAGPNGAGKTTFVEKISPDILSKTIFVNADNIARKLREKHPQTQKSELKIEFFKEGIIFLMKILFVDMGEVWKI